MNVLWYIVVAGVLKAIAVYGYSRVCTSVESYDQEETYFNHVSKDVSYTKFYVIPMSKTITVSEVAKRVVTLTRTKYFCCGAYHGVYPHCEPTCSTECTNGECTDPEVCTCNNGYGKGATENVCEPICLGECENGICSAPGKCSCLAGFRMDGPNRCVPTCDGGCPNGKCIAPNKCECENGYELNAVGTACEPVCSGGCRNGVCSAAGGECKCLAGFQMDGGGCLPVCDSGCPFGECVAPNKCECNAGYELNSLGMVCEPVCLNGCPNGICTLPNKCTCVEGFDVDENNRCVPVCDGGCSFGKCIAPNTCECQPGYTLSASGKICEPACTQGCEHGFCYRPEMCVCHQGYLMGPGNKCEPICHKGCINGVCIEPEICSCLPGYEMPVDSVNRCEPTCEPECQNSDCAQPGVCICWMNFVPMNKSRCEPLCPKVCFNGYCAEPNNCTCNEGYEAHDYEPNVCTPVCDGCEYGDCITPGNCLCWPGYEMNGNDSKCYLETEISTGGYTETTNTDPPSENSDEEITQHCDCWVLSSSNPGDCTPTCKTPNETSCIDGKTCQLVEDLKKLLCNGNIYLCPSNVVPPAQLTKHDWLWILLLALLIIIILVICFLYHHYRYRGSAIISEKADPQWVVLYDSSWKEC